MPRPILATIDLAAMRHNLAQARARAGRRTVWAVVKANAYGHGIERAVRAFAEADGLGLLDLAEARRAREAGWRKPILLLEGFFEPADLSVVDALRLTVVVHGFEQIEMLERHRPPQPIDVYLKLNTGMNRLGFGAADAARALARLHALPHVRVVSLMTHFANAERDDARFGRAAPTEQLRAFESLTAHWYGERCLANSAALFLQPSIGGDSVRPGIALYGATPDASVSAARLGLRPAMTLRSRVIGLQQLQAGDSVGYGSQFVAPRPMRIGIVACGYADGYPRHAPNGTPVEVDGVRAGTVGRVSMDMLCVDLTDVPAARVGSEVELWGERVPIDEVAAAAGTVGYQLMCALAQRVPVVEV
ncbi:MAG: alanine racemase [Burkholderiaceae bacterium]|nr:alanine racemase [Burkholderiaceae bacterium]